jgi:hypothetical protein
MSTMTARQAGDRHVALGGGQRIPARRLDRLVELGERAAEGLAGQQPELDRGLHPGDCVEVVVRHAAAHAEPGLRRPASRPARARWPRPPPPPLRPRDGARMRRQGGGAGAEREQQGAGKQGTAGDIEGLGVQERPLSQKPPQPRPAGSKARHASKKGRQVLQVERGRAPSSPPFPAPDRRRRATGRRAAVRRGSGWAAGGWCRPSAWLRRGATAPGARARG